MFRQISTRLAIVTVAGGLLLGCGELTPEVGKCTNSDPDQLLDFDVKIVECDASDATARLTKEAKNASECDSGRLTFEDKTFCTEPLKK